MEHRARALAAPVATLAGVPSACDPAEESGDDLPRAAFEEGVVEALRTWGRPGWRPPRGRQRTGATGST
ncbi:hypothetical protein AB0C10_20370 [Microbispora amethystogenes]|uniref:hypothetical protein n=1 Tax=Microbispora amethystogenes TaxID=1427754 RepID=UPI0033DFA2DF